MKRFILIVIVIVNIKVYFLILLWVPRTLWSVFHHFSAWSSHREHRVPGVTRILGFPKSSRNQGYQSHAEPFPRGSRNLPEFRVPSVTRNSDFPVSPEKRGYRSSENNISVVIWDLYRADIFPRRLSLICWLQLPDFTLKVRFARKSEYILLGCRGLILETLCFACRHSSLAGVLLRAFIQDKQAIVRA